MKSITLYIILIFLIGCQKTKHPINDIEIINYLKTYDLIQAKKIIDNEDSSLLKSLFLYEFNYLKNGINSKTVFNIDSLHNYNQKEQIIFHFMYGDFLTRKSNFERSSLETDKQIEEHYQTAYLKAKLEKDTLLQLESLKRINKYYQKTFDGDGSQDYRKFSKYQKELEKLANDTIDLFWANYYRINTSLLKIYSGQESINQISDTDFQKTLEYASKEPYLRGIIYQYWGIYYNLLAKNGDLGEQYFDLAKLEFNKSKIYLASKSLDGATFNNIISQYLKGNTQTAIVRFDSVLKREEPNSYRNLTKRQYAAFWLDSIYRKLGDYKTAKKYDVIRNEIRDIKRTIELENIAIEIDKKYESKEKDHIISNLENIIKSFKQHKLIYGSIIFIIFLLASYSIYRWREVDKKNKELKELVIKDHIILKNKIRIQLDELMYIESSGHYKMLFLTNKKEEFIRISIEELEKKLPPNFKRSHKRYLVNKNFIRNVYANEIILKNGVGIKLSRTYKANFKYKN